MPMLLRDLSTRSPRVCYSGSVSRAYYSYSLRFIHVQSGAERTYGAMITLAPLTGMRPTPSISSGTWPSQSSSCDDSVEAELEYHEPAWLARRVGIGFCRLGVGTEEGWWMVGLVG